MSRLLKRCETDSSELEIRRSIREIAVAGADMQRSLVNVAHIGAVVLVEQIEGMNDYENV